MIDAETVSTFAYMDHGTPGGPYCWLCGRDVKEGNPYSVHVGGGGFGILAIGERDPGGQDEDGQGGMGWFDIGPECRKKLPGDHVYHKSPFNSA